MGGLFAISSHYTTVFNCVLRCLAFPLRVYCLLMLCRVRG